MSDIESSLPSYEKMLNDAFSKIPTKTKKRARFEIPRLAHEIVSRRGPTIIYNFKDICDSLNRNPTTILKFMSKELGTPGNFFTPRVSFKGRFDFDTIKRLLDRYIQNYIICPVCNSPDSHLVKERRIKFLLCDACGAKSPVKQV
jgi:translation initiation factor 2 subunit 2